MNYYQILGVRATATDREIQAAYEAAASTDDLERKIEAAMAHSILMDPDRRDKFDQDLLISLRQQELDRGRAVPVLEAPTSFIHQHYHHHTANPTADFSLLKTGVIWFIMAMATTFLFFFMTIV